MYRYKGGKYFGMCEAWRLRKIACVVALFVSKISLVVRSEIVFSELLNGIEAESDSKNCVGPIDLICDVISKATHTASSRHTATLINNQQQTKPLGRRCCAILQRHLFAILYLDHDGPIRRGRGIL